MTDTGTCPWCNQEFTVTAYGHRLSCPHCGRHVDVLPEPNVWLETKWGTVGVTIQLTDCLRPLIG